FRPPGLSRAEHLHAPPPPFDPLVDGLIVAKDHPPKPLVEDRHPFAAFGLRLSEPSSLDDREAPDIRILRGDGSNGRPGDRVSGRGGARAAKIEVGGDALEG